MGRRASKRRWGPPKAAGPKVACRLPSLQPTTEHSLMAVGLGQLKGLLEECWKSAQCPAVKS